MLDRHQATLDEGPLLAKMAVMRSAQFVVSIDTSIMHLTVGAIAKSRLEAVDEISRRLQNALQHIDAERLIAAPNCGLGLLGRDLAQAKLRNLCETALWPAGTFWNAYTENQNDALDTAIEADPVGSAVRSLMTKHNEWTGTATNLLDVLGEEVGETLRKIKSWPSTPRSLSNKLKRAASFLRKVSISIKRKRKGHGGIRIIAISVSPDNAEFLSSASSVASAETLQTVSAPDHEGCGPLTQNAPIDANNPHADGTIDSEPPQSSAIADVADDTDAKLPTLSGSWKARI